MTEEDIQLCNDVLAACQRANMYAANPLGPFLMPLVLATAAVVPLGAAFIAWALYFS